MKNILTKLNKVQTELKAPKGQYNNFGKYKYRNCEDILEAVKPLLSKYGLVILISDEVEQIGERYYIKARATIYDIESGDNVFNSAYAREEETKKGMDASQITGSASSYARKYALNGLLAIDDTKDSDSQDNGSKPNVATNNSKQTTSGDEKQKLQVQIVNVAKNFKIDPKEVVAIIRSKYKKENTDEMTVDELKGLLKDVTSISREMREG